MGRDLRILLVEDEPAECREISRYIESVEGVRLVGVTNSAEKATELVTDCQPDAIILDIELHKGCGNGITFMRELRMRDPTMIPYVLITTNNISRITHDVARELGADFIMSKYQEDYNAENVVEFLKSVKSVILGKKLSGGGKNDNGFSPEEQEERNRKLVRKINAELDFVGISPKALGRKYITDGIMLTIEKPGPNLTTELGQRYGKSTPSVERAIQNCILGAWRNSDPEELHKHYKAKINVVRGAPTVTEFIYYYAEKIKNDM